MHSFIHRLNCKPWWTMRLLSTSVLLATSRRARALADDRTLSADAPPPWDAPDLRTMRPWDTAEFRTERAAVAAARQPAPRSENATVAVIFNGLLRFMDEKHVRVVAASVASPRVDAYVSSYVACDARARELAAPERTLLLSDEEREEISHKMYQWGSWQYFLLDRALDRWDFGDYATVARARTDIHQPPDFSYGSLVAAPGRIRAYSAYWWYSDADTFQRVFGDFFAAGSTYYGCETRDASTTGGAMHHLRNIYDRRVKVGLKPLNTRRSATIQGCKTSRDGMVPWSLGGNLDQGSCIYHDEWAFTYHILAHGAVCETLHVAGAWSPWGEVKKFVMANGNSTHVEWNNTKETQAASGLRFNCR